MVLTNNSSRPCLFRKDFTLLELLIVIAIIAILAAMLLPALNKARATAFGSMCMSNLKQVAYASLQYAGQNKDMIALGDLGMSAMVNTGEIPKYKNAACPLLPNENHNSTCYGSFSANGDGNYTAKCRKLGPANSGGGTSSSPIEYYAENVSWGLYKLFAVKVNRVKQASSAITFFDSIRYNYNATDPAKKRDYNYSIVSSNKTLANYQNNGAGVPHMRHSDGINVAFVDGHASRITSAYTFGREFFKGYCKGFSSPAFTLMNEHKSLMHSVPAFSE